jgi:hypothetical protein
MNKHKNPVDGLIEALEIIINMPVIDTSVEPICRKALKEYREAEQPKSCPLYTDYKKSCKALAEREKELKGE